MDVRKRRARQASLVFGVLISTTLAACICIGVSRRADAQELTLAEIGSAWKQRENSVRSVEIEWTTDRFETKGARLTPELARLSGESDLSGIDHIPESDMRWEVQSRLILDGSMMRLESSDMQHFSEVNAFKRVRFVSSYDGKSSRTYKWFPHLGTGQGTEEQKEWNVSRASSDIAPVLLAFRPVSPPMG